MLVALAATPKCSRDRDATHPPICQRRQSDVQDAGGEQKTRDAQQQIVIAIVTLVAAPHRAWVAVALFFSVYQLEGFHYAKWGQR
jgi:hypothetical protein